MGKPYVIEFVIPFSRMETFEKQDVARYMLEEWIHMDIRKDKTEHQYDGRIEFEIPPQNIVCVHEVEDGFPEMDKWLFEQAIIAFHLAFTATLRIGEVLGLTWDAMDISEEAIAANRAYVYINKEVERVSKQAVEELNSKDIILIFPSQKKNNKTVRVLKSPKTDSSKRKVFIPKSVAQCLIELKKDQEEIIEALGNEYQNYNLVMATTFGLPIGDSYLRTKMQDIIDELGLPDVVFHSLRHTSVTYKLKLSGGDIKAVQGDSGHAQADMVTEVCGHILDEDRRKNAELMENAFYNKENLNPQMKAQDEGSSTITVPDGVDAELLMKVLGNPEMTALLTSLAKTMKV